MPTFFTVRDVAECVRRADEDIDAVMFRLKNWTKEGLLRPARGKQSPGTGVPHSYTKAAFIDALILTALTDWGIPAVRAATYGTAENTMLGLGRRAFDEARKLKAGEPIDGVPVLADEVQKYRSGTVLLVIARQQEKAHARSQDVFIQYPWSKPHTEHFASMITLNITRLLERIKQD